MQTEVEGIVLKETLYSETSKVLQVITKEYGLISVIAKGASSLKSSLRSLTIPFLYAKFSITYKENKLSILKNGKVIKLYGQGSKDLKNYAYMSYLSELSLNVLKENNDKNIFNILKTGLDKLDSNLNHEVIKNIIEFKYLDYLGITPNLEVCQKCYKTDNLYAIDGKIGGFVCRDCYHNEKIINEKIIKILRRYQNVNLEEVKEIKISKEDEKLVSLFLKEYYDTFSGMYIKSRVLLDTLTS